MKSKARMYIESEKSRVDGFIAGQEDAQEDFDHLTKKM